MGVIEGWREVTLAQVAAPSKNAIVDGPFGSALPASEYVEDGVPIIRGVNLTRGQERFIDENYVFIPDLIAQRLSRAMCHAEDIIFTKKGTIGQVGIIPSGSRFSSFLISSNQMRLTVNKVSYDPYFIYYSISSPKNRDKIINDSTATGVPKINLSYLRKFTILVPPLHEQRAIAHVLGSLDDKIELNREMNRTLEELARTVFKAWFVDFEGQTAFEEVEGRRVPQGWRVGRLGDVITAQGGSTPSTKDPTYWEGGTIAWTSPKDLSGNPSPVLLDTERKITPAGLALISSGLLPKGTLLLSSRAPIGYLAISQVPIAINQGYIAIAPGQAFSPLYMYFWCQQHMDLIKAKAGGTTFPEISKSSFRTIDVLIPPPTLLQKFEQFATPIFEKIVSNEQQSRTLRELRDALLPKLISGELRVRDAERFL